MRSNNYKEKADADLWDLMTQGDIQALEQLYHNHYSFLYSYALTLHRDDELAMDCIHDLFINLFTYKNLRPVIHVRAYFCRSLKNILINKISNTVINLTLDEDISCDFPIEDTELTRLFSHNDEDLEQSRLLVKAYNQLPENQKNAIYLHYIKEFTWDEMAVVLAISSHSCMNLVARSIAKLRSLVNNVEKNRK